MELPESTAEHFTIHVPGRFPPRLLGKFDCFARPRSGTIAVAKDRSHFPRGAQQLVHFDLGPGTNWVTLQSVWQQSTVTNTDL